MTVVNHERERAELREAIVAGHGFVANEPRDELGGRSLHDVWDDGDHGMVEHWLDTAFTMTDALAESLRDMEDMARFKRSA